AGAMERDYETLVPRAPSRTERLAVNHVAKGKSKRSRGADVVFDPAKHKEFITGFRKRKQQRRKAAQENNKERERKARLETRAEASSAFCSMKVHQGLMNHVPHATHVQRRAKLKEELGFDDKWGASDEDDEAGPAAVRHGTDGPVKGDTAAAAAHKEVRVFKQAGQMTTVKIVPIQLQSDSDVEEEDGDLEDGGLQGAGHGAAQREQQGAQPRHQAATTQKSKWQKPQKGGVRKGKGKPQQKRKGKGRPQR
ncbi:hypothetical protein QJQ45_025406, partial [Haematococcus lacustris]